MINNDKPNPMAPDRPYPQAQAQEENGKGQPTHKGDVPCRCQGECCEHPREKVRLGVR